MGTLSDSIATCFYAGFQLRAATNTKDAGGANIETWANGATFNGHIRKFGSRELVENSKRAVNSTHRLYCPVDTAIAKTNRVTFDSKEYHVTFVDDVHEMDEFLQVELFYDEVES